MESNQARNPEVPSCSEDERPLDEVSCLVCVHSAKELEHFLAWFAAKGAAEAPMLHRLKETYGLCPSHSWQLARTGQAHQLAALYRSLIQETMKKLEAFRRVLGEPYRRVQTRAKEMLQPKGACLACEHQAVAAEEAMHTLVRSQHSFQRGRGAQCVPHLCIGHFFQAIEKADRETALVLLQLQRRKLERLAGEFGEYFRKLDPRFHEEPKGSEQTAWLQAVQLITGQPIEKGNKPVDRRKLIALRHSSGAFGFGLAEAFDQPGCPICRLVPGRLEQFFFWFLGENYHDLGVIEKLLTSFGFCPAHAQKFIQDGEVSTVAFVYDLLVQGILHRIDELLMEIARRGLKRWRRGSQRAGTMGAVPGVCLACEKLREGTDLNLFWLFRALETSEGRDRYRCSDGLCLIHCLEALSMAEDTTLLIELVEKQVAGLRVLLGELETFLGGHSRGGEPAAKSSWWRAVERFAGGDPSDDEA